MNTSGEAADQIVRMSLEAGDAALKISGEGAKHLAILLVALLKQKKKTKGRARLETLVRSGKPLTVFSVKESDLRKFVQEAKRYGILYSAIRHPKGKGDGMVDIMVKEEDAPRINRIVERFKFATVTEAAQVRTEIEKARETKAAETEKETTKTKRRWNPRTGRTAGDVGQKEPSEQGRELTAEQGREPSAEMQNAHRTNEVEPNEKSISEQNAETTSEKNREYAPEQSGQPAPGRDRPEKSQEDMLVDALLGVPTKKEEPTQNPSTAKTAKSRQSAPISARQRNSAGGTSKLYRPTTPQKPSVREELRKIREARKKEADAPKRSNPERNTKTKTDQSPRHRQPQAKRRPRKGKER